jgi:hypothetical protein
MNEFLKALPLAATSILAFVAYLCVLAAWTVILLKTKRIKSILRSIEKIPENDRRAILEAEMNIKLPDKISPAHWLKARQQTYLFYGMVVLILAVVIVFALTLFTRSKQYPPAEPDLKVSFSASYRSALAEIANIGSGIIKIRNLSLESTYEPPPYLIPPPVGAKIQVFKYDATLNSTNRSYKLDSAEFKYGPGDIDHFDVALNFAQDGVYTIGLAFDYQIVGSDSNKWQHYQGPTQCLAICFSAFLPNPGVQRVMIESGNCEELPYRAFLYIQDLVEYKFDMSREDAIEYVRKNYPCEQIRAQYIQIITNRMRSSNSTGEEIAEKIGKTPSCP